MFLLALQRSAEAKPDDNEIESVLNKATETTRQHPALQRAAEIIYHFNIQMEEYRRSQSGSSSSSQQGVES